MGDPITPPGPGPDPAQPDEPLPMPDDNPFPTPLKPPSKEPSPDSPKIGDDAGDILPDPPEGQLAAYVTGTLAHRME